ncbi:MAG: alpha/beta-type small acid-soluble spore protein [Clostridiales bacterium]|nr:alpha/beta-type small acid-soluble spore protein [Clostridiales bacterium]MDY2834061.1 alpha/beta-type small acid-soluble spore protein [Candidatus Aphodomonas sp.]
MFTPNINAQQGNQQAQGAGTKQSGSGNRIEVPQAKDALNNMKHEIAGELGINLKQGYNGDLTSRQAGYIGGYMVKRLIEQQEKAMAGK